MALASLLPANAATRTAEVRLAWDASPSPEVIGYRICWGTTSRRYTNNLDVGLVTMAMVGGLSAGTTYYFAARAYAAGGVESDFSNEVQYAVPGAPLNHPPTLSALPDRTIPEDTSTGPIAFTVGDVDHDPATLGVSVVSSNPALVPAAGRVLGGSGATRTLTVTPAAKQTGWAVIVVYVSDGTLTTARSFVLFVVPRLPAPWQVVNPGRSESPGVAEHRDGMFTLLATGQGIGGFADEGVFLFQRLSGDGEISARVRELELGTIYPKAGLMIRENLDGAARMVFLHISPYSVSLSWRANPGSYAFATFAGAPQPAPNNWLRLVRTGTLITAYHSSDSVTWFPVSMPLSLELGEEAWIGLAASSGFSWRTNAAVFDRVRVVP